MFLSHQEVGSTSKIHPKPKHFFSITAAVLVYATIISLWLTAIALWLSSSFPLSLYPETRVIFEKYQSDYVMALSKPFKASFLPSKSCPASSCYLQGPPELAPHFVFHVMSHIFIAPAHTILFSNQTTSTYSNLASRPSHMLIRLLGLASFLFHYSSVHSSVQFPFFQVPFLILPSSYPLWHSVTHSAFTTRFTPWNVAAWLPLWLPHDHVGFVKDRSVFFTVNSFTELSIVPIHSSW